MAWEILRIIGRNIEISIEIEITNTGDWRFPSCPQISFNGGTIALALDDSNFVFIFQPRSFL